MCGTSTVLKIGTGVHVTIGLWRKQVVPRNSATIYSTHGPESLRKVRSSKLVSVYANLSDCRVGGLKR